MVLSDVRIGRIRILSSGIVDNHALVCTHDILDDRFRQRRCGHGLVAQLHDDPVTACRGFRRDPRPRPSRKNEQPALGT